MKVKYVCTKCGKAEDVTTRAPKCECGGLWKLQYELPKFDEALIDKEMEHLPLPCLYAPGGRNVESRNHGRRHDAHRSF